MGEERGLEKTAIGPRPDLRQGWAGPKSNNCPKNGLQTNFFLKKCVWGNPPPKVDNTHKKHHGHFWTFVSKFFAAKRKLLGWTLQRGAG